MAIYYDFIEEGYYSKPYKKAIYVFLQNVSRDI